MTECAGVALILSTAEPSVRGIPPTIGNKTVSLKPEGLEMSGVEMAVRPLSGVPMSAAAEVSAVTCARQVSSQVFPLSLKFPAVKAGRNACHLIHCLHSVVAI